MLDPHKLPTKDTHQPSIHTCSMQKSMHTHNASLLMKSFQPRWFSLLKDPPILSSALSQSLSSYNRETIPGHQTRLWWWAQTMSGDCKNCQSLLHCGTLRLPISQGHPSKKPRLELWDGPPSCSSLCHLHLWKPKLLKQREQVIIAHDHHFDSNGLQ